MFYKVVGDSYQCVSKCDELPFGEFDAETGQVKCMDECGEESFVDSQIGTSD